MIPSLRDSLTALVAQWRRFATIYDGDGDLAATTLVICADELDTALLAASTGEPPAAGGTLREAIEQLLAFGEEEKESRRKASDREQYQFYGGWVAALQRVLALTDAERSPSPAAIDARVSELNQLARDIGTVIQVAERRTFGENDRPFEKHDHGEMLRTLREWRTRLHKLAVERGTAPETDDELRQQIKALEQERCEYSQRIAKALGTRIDRETNFDAINRLRRDAERGTAPAKDETV